jgi:hypothetical protein
MIRSLRDSQSSIHRRSTKLSLLALAICIIPTGTLVAAQNTPTASTHTFYIDCTSSNTGDGDGSSTHPWRSLATAQAHPFFPGDRIALARGTVCRGSFAPQGSGSADHPIRLTAYGSGPRPRIVASTKDRQALSLFNQEFWQIDSIDISGGNTYGIFVSGDIGTLRHIYLKNLLVHNVQGGDLKNKDNGLVIVGPSGPNVIFQDVLVDGVIAAHTNQWAGILIGGGNYAWKADAPLNSHIIVRNSTVQDVYGDGIVLFRDSDGLIETSVAFQTGMQPTETTGTPNAIWTWTCTDCAVRDNEAFLTDSPGLDGGAYDIDWDNTRNIVERNYAHDTQGYCFAAFAAGYVTRESVIRDNLCVDNGLSPRLAALQGAVYLHTWNDGTLRGLRIEHNTFHWNPPVATAAAIVDDAATGGDPILFTGNRIDSSVPFFYRTNAQFVPSANIYHYDGPGEAQFTVGDRRNTTLTALHAVGMETGTTLDRKPSHAPTATSLHIDATIDLTLDSDGLLSPAVRAQWIVLHSLAAQYSTSLTVTAHLVEDADVIRRDESRINALRDLDPGPVHIQEDRKNDVTQAGLIRMLSADGNLIEQWHGFQNAATLGGAVRARLGAPQFAKMPQTIPMEEAK